jgi:hypothetical protein
MDTTRATIKQELGSGHFSLDWVKFSTQEYTELNNQKQDSVATRNESVQFIDNPDAIVSKAVELLDSPEWSEVAAGLSVLTGRRSSELLSTANFEKASKWSVVFTGALKRRGELQELSFEIPTLTTADLVVKALEKVRSELPQAKNLPANQVNSKFGGAVARACDKHFEGLVPYREGKDNLYTHLFRAVYATIATFWYCPPHVNDTEFKATIQGHYAVLDAGDLNLRRSLAASRHYSDYEIADSVIAQYGGKRKGIKLGHGGVKPLAVFARSAQSANDQSMIQPPPKHRSSLRVWREDHELVAEVLERFEGKTQPDKVGEWIRWTLEQLQKPSESAAIEPVKAIEPEPEPQVEELEELQEEVEAIQSVPVQSTEPIGSETLPAPALETKIDTLVNAIAQLVQLQTQALTTPTPAQTQAPVTRRKASAPTPTAAEANGQSERKYRPRGENQELVDRAIDAIMQHNDGAERHDDKWAITINGLKGLGIKSQHAITRALEARVQEIEQHHAQHQIDAAKHNLRHRGKAKIEDVIEMG